MAKSIRSGVAVALVVGFAGCGDFPLAGPTLSGPSVQQPQPNGLTPRITAIAPAVGSTRGGAWSTITGTDFQAVTVRIGNSSVPATTRNGTTIMISGTPAHVAGVVDVVVTNSGGRDTTLPGGYSYQLPGSFDFNGDWVAHAGPEFDVAMRFTIRDNVLVSVSCNASEPFTFTPAPTIRDGEFAFLGSDGQAISGTLVSPVNSVGTINVPSCPPGKWWADKSGQAP